MNQQLRAVSRLWLLLATFLFAQGAWAQVSLTTINSPYTQDFNTLSNTAGSTTNTALPTGFFLTETGGGARDNEQYAVDTGSSTTGDTYSYGTAASADRALGGLRSGTLIPVIGAAFTNNTSSTIVSLSITYAGEEWRLGTAGRADRLDFQYSTDATSLTAGTYTDVDALDFNTPTTTTTGAKDGNATANRTLVTSTITGLSIAPGATFWIRFNDLDASGADDGLSIDDFSITPIAASPALTANPTSLTSFVATQGSVSPAQTYTVTGSNLDGNPVSVSATAGIELSTNNTTFTATLSLPASASAISQEIFARLTNTAPTGPFSGTITNTANTTLTASVTVSGQVNAPSAPALSASPTTLSGFSTPQGTVSAEQTYTLTAANLTAGISVSAPTGVEVSQTTGSGFASSLTLPMSTTSAVVYVHLTGAGAAGPVSGTITNVSGSQTANVAVSGTVSSTAPATLISQIQGSGLTSPLTSTTQTIEGIVTRKFTGATGLNGFYVQEEVSDYDSDPNTSEGIFIFDNTGVFTGNPGDKVRITGAVTEFVTTVTGFPSSSLTEITLTSAANLVTVSTGNPLPTVTNVTLPVANVSDLERYEGMLVNMSAASGNLTVTEYFQLGRYGQVVLSATGATDQPGTDPRLDQYTQFFAPSVAGYTTYLAEIAKRRIYLDDGQTPQNVDPIIFGRGGQPLSASNTLRGGDNIASITAILDERSEGYRLQTNTGVNFQPANPRPATPPAVGGTLRVGNFNLLNYFNDLGTSNFTNCSGNAIGRRGANNATEFTRQRDKIINAIINSGSDVLGLNEMENNGFTATSAIQDLVNGLNAVAGANSFTYINSGCISSDAITVAMVYKPALVTPVGASAAIPFNYGTGSFTDVGRRSLAQTFQQNSNGAVFTLVSNHWKSKGSSAGGAGDADAGDGQSASNGTRTRQAQDVVSWLATNPTGTTDPDYLLVGDLNAYAKEDPLTTLETSGYTNLIPNTTYSYVFDGFAGALDHGLRSASLQSQVAGADKWHINADEPSVLDYNTEFKTPGQVASLYSSEQYRASDHDPVLIGLTLAPPVSPLSLTLTANPTMLTTSGTTTLSATVSGGTTPYSYTFSGPGTITPSGNTASVSGIPAGVQTYTVVASDATSPTSQTVSGTVSVTVTQANTPPVATSNANQTATVGVAFSYTVNAFTDSETPNSLTYSASISPANGFSFDADTRVISGTPSMSGVSSVTVTATDPGSLSASTTFTITVSPVACPQSVTNINTNATFCTIQAAIDDPATLSGHTIRVGAYTYPEAVTVNKSLTILGANAGVSGFGTRSTESIIDGEGTRTNLLISAPNVVIDGFKFIAGQGTYGAAVAFNGQQADGQIINNIFTDNLVGVVEPSANAAIKHNLFDGNNREGAAGGSGIYTDVATNGLTIEDNEFKNHTNNSAVVFGATASNTHLNVSFIRNYIHDNNGNNSMVYCIAINGGTFARNTINQPGATALKFAGANSSIMVLNNFLDNNGVGVRVADDGYGLGSNTGIEVHNNSLTNNSIKAIDNPEAAATINATCNWYGTTNVASQSATLFGGPVTYSPYLSSGTDNEGDAPGFQPVPGSCTSMLSLTFTASPDMILTSGTTTLSATVSGGNTPLTYTFTGPGTITPSGNTASVSNIPAGVQTFTVVVSDATTPTSQTISGTVSVTVSQANTPPVATANANQTATVGVAFSYTVNAFTDAETPNSLTYSASIDPANGLSFDPASRIISGTPSMSGVSSVTITATDPGSLSASTTFTITVSPAPVVVTSLSLTVSASPNMILTSGTTTLSATVSGGTTPYSYVFTGPGTITPSGNTASVSGLPAGVQTFTVVASDATSPTAQTISGTVSVTVSPANTAPTVANPVPPQSATVGVGYTLSLANVFTDAETPNQLTLAVSGLPAGLSFTAPSTISGTPSTTVGSPFSVTVTATDPGSLSAGTTFTITVSPAGSTPAGPFSLTGVTTISCTPILPNRFSLSFNPRYQGLDGTPVSFSVTNELLPTTDPGPYTLQLYSDNPTITLNAVQSGVSSSFVYNWLAACSSTTTPNTPPRVVTSIPSQTAAVGSYFSYVIPDNTFTDDETPSSLRLSAAGVPPGLSFAGATLSGTPSTTVGSPFSLTITATDPGSLSVSTSFVLTVFPAGTTPQPTVPFAITGVTTISCTPVSDRINLVFAPRYVGMSGQSIAFEVVNELSPTTDPAPYSLTLYRDNPVITLRATQTGSAGPVSFSYNWLAACATVGQDNTPPRLNEPVQPQSATVGVGYSLNLLNTFIDQETPDQITLSAVGLPAGLTLSGKQISGTPSMSGVSSVTLTATDGGGLSTRTSFTITVNPAGSTPPPAGGPFSITGVQTVSCEVISAGERRVTFNPQYAGLDGSPVSFSVVNELAATTNPGPYTLRLYTDNPVITLRAVQSGVGASFAYSWLTACNPGARLSSEPVAPLRVRVLGNPVRHTLEVEVTGAVGSSLHLDLTDGQGRVVGQQHLDQAGSLEKLRFTVSHQPAGVLILRANTPTQSQTIRVVKVE